jgi:amphiphysin
VAIDKLIVESKNFRDAWTRILSHQTALPTQWTQIYQPIPRDSSRSGQNEDTDTPVETMDILSSYSTCLAEVKETLLPVLDGMDGKVVQPAIDMRKALEQVAKLVKKRHHKKMDYDRFTQSVRPPNPSFPGGF